ncbi:MAG: alanine--glyoxylate aminotransferase family protein [Bacteroidota bacterium]|nr:alanine--glyoxylate aminotransferase family protein [Candidatus Kapabacteria bacterium]MDW8219754.1 alanine--glyoxylate aminotransferase family protein [Bacteroidota bacterium]
MNELFMRKPRLFTPGPTPIPEHVMLRMAHPIIHHRHAEFTELVGRINRRLQYLFCTQQPVLTLTSSGTGAAEAAIATLFRRGEKGININNGKFAERWGKMMRVYDMNVLDVHIPWGEAIGAEQLECIVRQHHDAACVWLVHSETSTGTYTDIRQMAQVIRTVAPNALICIDGITSIGAHECRMDDWDIDVVITGSQKGLMIPPGLAFIALSERAWAKAADVQPRSLYFNLHKAREAWHDNSTPWTPAVSLFIGLDAALDMIIQEGREALWQRHALLSRGLRAGLQAINIRLFGTSPSHAVTVAYLPEQGKKDFIPLLKKTFGITVIGGQDTLQGVVFRTSHLGYYDEADMLAVLASIEQVLHCIGFSFEAGRGVYTAQRLFMGVE